jgi:hypothetical protein
MMRPWKPETDTEAANELFAVRTIRIPSLQISADHPLIPSRSDDLIVRL